MKQIKTEEEKKRLFRRSGLILLLCFACFEGGLMVPALMRRNCGTSSDEFEKLTDIYNILRNNWYYAGQSENLDSRLLEQAITGMTTLEEDLHTNYFSLEQAQAFNQTLAGSNVGIGVSFFQGADGQMVVSQVFTNSTADTAGLQAGDEIVQIGDLACASASVDDLVALIKSSDGVPLDLQVLRNGEVQTVTVTPGTYDSTVSSTIGDGYGVVTLSSFSENSGAEFASAVEKIQEAGQKNLIIDLRNNSGGYLSAAQDIASSLLPKDAPIFIEKTANGNEKTLTTSGKYDQIPFDHIYILQNENSASASEVLIGALKDNLGPQITTVGTTTYGKGTEQVSAPFTDGTSLKYTVAEWLTPNGTSINKTGFAPDVEVSEDLVRTIYYTPMDENSPSILPDSVGANAKPAQVYLQYLGYPADRQDEYFSSASSYALSLFQMDHGLEATGVLDAASFNALVDAVSLQLNLNRAAEDRAMQTAVGLIQNPGQ